eukprot:353950-Chlamydomonas_euryale.AAC.2
MNAHITQAAIAAGLLPVGDIPSDRSPSLARARRFVGRGSRGRGQVQPSLASCVSMLTILDSSASASRMDQTRSARSVVARLVFFSFPFFTSPFWSRFLPPCRLPLPCLLFPFLFLGFLSSVPIPAVGPSSFRVLVFFPVLPSGPSGLFPSFFTACGPCGGV